MKLNFHIFGVFAIVFELITTLSIKVSPSGELTSLASTYEKSKESSRKEVAYESPDLLNSSLQAIRRSDELREVIRIEDRTEKLIRELKAFTHPTNFDAVKFENSASLFEAELLDIISAFGELQLFKEEVVKKVAFVRFMYQVMLSSCVYMNTFNSTVNVVEYMVHTIIELNVMIFKLLNSNGEPESSSSGYSKEVERLSQFLMAWKKTATKLEVVPSSSQRILDDQVTQAEKILFVLKAAIED